MSICTSHITFALLSHARNLIGLLFILLLFTWITSTETQGIVFGVELRARASAITKVIGTVWGHGGRGGVWCAVYGVPPDGTRVRGVHQHDCGGWFIRVIQLSTMKAITVFNLFFKHYITFNFRNDTKVMLFFSHSVSIGDCVVVGEGGGWG